MTQLVEMSETEFEAFLVISSADHIGSQITAGYWRPDEAEANMQKTRDQVLPQGFNTPNQFFWKIVNDKQETVGGLWYMLVERDGQQLVFIVDIQIYEPYRRSGYGTQAFQLMEDQVKEMGIQAIALNVFKHNHPARAMYEKLGYVGEGESMVKDLGKTG